MLLLELVISNDSEFADDDNGGDESLIEFLDDIRFLTFSTDCVHIDIRSSHSHILIGVAFYFALDFAN